MDTKNEETVSYKHRLSDLVHHKMELVTLSYEIPSATNYCYNHITNIIVWTRDTPVKSSTCLFTHLNLKGEMSRCCLWFTEEQHEKIMKLIETE